MFFMRRMASKRGEKICPQCSRFNTYFCAEKVLTMGHKTRKYELGFECLPDVIFCFISTVLNCGWHNRATVFVHMGRKGSNTSSGWNDKENEHLGSAAYLTRLCSHSSLI